MATLTLKQQSFAHSWASGMTKADAYRSAYDCASMSPAAIRVEACRLSQHPNITLIASEITQQIDAELVQLAAYDKKKAFEDASKDRDLAHQERQAGAAVSATKLKAQLAGHLDDASGADRALEGLASLMQSISERSKHATLNYLKLSLIKFSNLDNSRIMVQ